MDQEKALDTLIKKTDGVVDDLRTNSYRLDKLETTIESRFDSLGVQIENLTKAVQDLANNVGLISRQFGAVTSKVIEQGQHLASVESRVDVLETH